MQRAARLGLAAAIVTLGAETRELARERFQPRHNPSIAQIVRDAGNGYDHLPVCPDTLPGLVDGEKPSACRLQPPYSPIGADSGSKQWQTFPGWAVAANVADGERLLDEWKSQAEKAARRDCVEDQCSVVVRMHSDRSSEERLGLCRFVFIDGTPGGAPLSCTLLAVKSTEGTWIRVARGFERTIERTMGLLDTRYRVAGASESYLPEALKGLQKALEAPPFQMDTQVPYARRLTGISQYKASQVLKAHRPPLREIATVVITAEAVSGPQPSYVVFDVATNLMVNPLATTRPQDWSMPGPEQQSEYVKAVRTALKSELQKNCATPVWRTETTLTCGMPPQAPLPAEMLQ